MQGSPQSCFSLGIAPSDALVQSRSKWEQIKENAFRALGVFLSPPCTLLSAYSRRLVAMATSDVCKLLIKRKASILWAKQRKKEQANTCVATPTVMKQTNEKKTGGDVRFKFIRTCLINYTVSAMGGYVHEQWATVWTHAQMHSRILAQYERAHALAQDRPC